MKTINKSCSLIFSAFCSVRLPLVRSLPFAPLAGRAKQIIKASDCSFGLALVLGFASLMMKTLGWLAGCLCGATGRRARVANAAPPHCDRAKPQGSRARSAPQLALGAPLTSDQIGLSRAVVEVCARVARSVNGIRFIFRADKRSPSGHGRARSRTPRINCAAPLSPPMARSLQAGEQFAQTIQLICKLCQ